MERLEALTGILERSRKLEFVNGRDFTMADIPVEDLQEVYGTVMGRIFKWQLPSYIVPWGPTKTEWEQELMAQIREIGNIRPYN